MGAESRISVIDDLRRASVTNREQLLAGLNQINQAIQRNGAGRNPQAPVPFAALARLLLYVAVDAAEQRREQIRQERRPRTDEEKREQTAKLRPNWMAVMEPYNRFCDEVGGNLLPRMESEAGVVSDDGLAAFCTFATRRTGNHTQRFYAGLAAFAVHLHEAQQLTSAFLDMARPDCEKDLPARIRKELDRVFSLCRGEGAPDEAEPPAYPEIQFTFACEPGDISRFDSFRRHLSVPEDGYAHFVIYRPSRSRPERLMKSFLAIAPPAVDERIGSDRRDLFRFVHIYKPPEQTAGAVQRVSLGRVLPLTDGLYLIGGQRDETLERRPFNTLKVLALPWTAIAREDKILNALVMSANYDGRHILSRAAVRPTCVARSERLHLGSVEVADLYEDLRNDAISERQAFSQAATSAEKQPVYGGELDPDRFPLCCDPEDEHDVLLQHAELIASNCNNRPRPEVGWDLESGYEPLHGKKGDGPLTRNGLSFKIEEILGSRKAPKYARATRGGTREPFDFWSSIRFGPLSHD